MCDLYSWGKITSRSAAKKLGKPFGSIIFLTDSEAQILLDASEDVYGRTFHTHDVIGHTALAAYYRIAETDIEHFESFNEVPRPLARAINAGQLDKMWQWSDKYNEGATPPRFTTKGVRKGGVTNAAAFVKAATKLVADAMQKLYPDRDNTEALKRAKNAFKTRRCSVDGLFTWSDTPEAHNYWSAIHNETRNAINVLL